MAIAPTQAPRTSSPTVRNLIVIFTFLATFHLPGFPAADQTLPQASEINPAALPNFSAVHSYFWRGAAPTFAGLDELKALGVKTVIDLRRSENRIEEERKYCSWIGINYVSLPMGDFIPPLSQQKQFLSIITAASKNTFDAPVFLHCSHGSDRTGYLTALWRVTHDHWSPFEALVEMLQHGFFVHKFEPRP